SLHAAMFSSSLHARLSRLSKTVALIIRQILERVLLNTIPRNPTKANGTSARLASRLAKSRLGCALDLAGIALLQNGDTNKFQHRNSHKECREEENREI